MAKLIIITGRRAVTHDIAFQSCDIGYHGDPSALKKNK